MEDNQLLESKVIDTQIKPGELLKEAREKSNKTISDIASKMFLRHIVIKNIEKDNYTEDISTTFWLGYIRAYSKFVPVDKQQLEIACNNFFGQQTKDNYINYEHRNFVLSDAPRFRLNKFIITFFILFTVYLSFYWKLGKDKFDLKLEKKQSYVDLQIPNINETSLANKTKTANSEKKEHPINSATQKLKEPIKVNKATNSNQESLSLPSDKKKKKPQTIYATLKIKVKYDTWFNVVDANGKLLYSGKLIAGNSKLIKYRSKIYVFISQANGVKLRINNRAFNMRKYQNKENFEIIINKPAR